MMTADPAPAGKGRYGRIGKYQILSHIATGGVCAIYKAVDVDLGREVALKILPSDLAAKPNVMERFRREARHAARLRHDNIVAIYEFGQANGTYFLALEFVAGTDLFKLVSSEGPLEPQESLVYLIQLTRALEHLHKFGVVHRDVKPSNILLAQRDGRPIVKLTDLGLARLASEDDFRITQAGFTVGTVDYMSPEQARDSGEADIRSDIYSLGCTWFHLLTGRPPFPEGGLTERLLKHLRDEPPSVRQFNPRVSVGMAAVVRRMLAKDPGDRYPTPADLMRDLTLLERGGTPVGALPQAKEERKPVAPAAVAQPTPSWNDGDSTQDVDLANVVAALSSQEQRQAAAGQFARANEVLASGNFDYALHLLLSCCKLDPANREYRRMLRRTERARPREKGRFTFLSTSAPRTKLKAARSAGDYLKVLEYGEEILIRDPWDVAAQMDMAEAAEALEMPRLAAWLLEQAWRKEAPDIAVSRALARLYERYGNLNRAIKFWDWVRKADPTDVEASRKPRDLAARETISRGQYKQELSRRD
jgi:serine/threonine protein kinase